MKKADSTAPDTVLEESPRRLLRPRMPDILLLGPERKFVRRRSLKPGKVALISGRPVPGMNRCMLAMSARGMLDAACPRPGLHLGRRPDQMIEAAEAVDTGAGVVLFIVQETTKAM